MTTKRAKFVVTIRQPEGVTKYMLRAYIHDAISSWCGQFMPPGGDPEEGMDPDGDPLWGIGDGITVKGVK